MSKIVEKKDWLNPKDTVHAVLCYLSKGEEYYLLLLKSKGKFGEGFWNAPGGKIEPNETAEDAARREVLEETGLEVIDIIVAGYLRFYFGENKTRPDWEVTVFTSTRFVGNTIESGEGKLKWFRKEELPYEEMWADDREWLPILVEGKKKFVGAFVFSKDSKKLLNSSITFQSS